jgi:hypothetical protein
VAVGVSRAPPLEVLDGAITDAIELAKWATKNGYKHVHALTDEHGGSVTAKGVYDLCEGLLKIGDLEQLLVFFSGHGYSPLPGHEVWLLSDWNSNANEAINASTTLLIAKGFERPQISFMVDACRQTWNEAQGTTGIVILPKAKSPSGNSQVDEFYATAFGAISQQYQPAQRLASYGVFSKELLKGLKGAAAVERGHQRVVTSRSLEDYLKESVPLACANIRDAAIQYPEAKAQWRSPKDIYVELTRAKRVTRGRTRSALTSPVVKKGLNEREERIKAEAQRYQAAEGRGSYETATGLTIIGAEVISAVASSGHVEPFKEGGAWHIRVSGFQLNEIPTEPSTILVQISNDRWPRYWISVLAFPSLVGIALIDENGFSSLNYRPARRFRQPESETNSPKIEAMLAESSAMFRHGVMPSLDRMRDMIELMRNYKLDNPALAVLAAHICYRLGDIDQILDMEQYKIGGGKYTPYDFLLLTGKRKPAAKRSIVGHFPVMSPSWGLLPVAEFNYDKRLLDVAAKLVPSLWTMATPAAGDFLAQLVSPILEVDG